MGKFDSSKTRVMPVFDELLRHDNKGHFWLEKLIGLPICGNRVPLPPGCDFTIQECAWGDMEKKLEPPVALLSWLIRHSQELAKREVARDTAMPDKRRDLLNGSESRMLEALELLRNNPGGEKWHIFEGETQPDVFIRTPTHLVVIEGKRTEPHATTSTTWMPVRHQMLRHLDCAWEIRGNKEVVGFFIVQGENGSEEVPMIWQESALQTTSDEAVGRSLPHRGPDEQNEIAKCFAGVTTWERVCREFGIDLKILPDRTSS
jgi:hypothetical protein